MPWSTPKTDWGAGDGVANTDLNRIEGNAQYLKDDIDSHKADGSAHSKPARFVIGTSTAGWTSADCDYLCDGTADDVEINAAITALPATGGEIVILDGTYNITAKIDITKNNVSIRGNGNATILKRMFESSTTEGIITLTAASGCTVEKLYLDGNKANYTARYNPGILLRSSSDNTIVGNTCNNNSYPGINLSSSSNENTIIGNTCNNNDYPGIYLSSNNENTIIGNTCNNNNFGIYLASSNENIISGNICNNNSNSGINLDSSNDNTITGNTCNNNNYYGIYSPSGNKNTITGNACNNNDYGIYLSSSNENTIIGNTCNNNYYGIYLSSSNDNTITGNTCNNNSTNYGISLSSSSNDNTITGNTCNNNFFGIYSSSGNKNTITGNTCNNNEAIGINLYSSSNNTITGNTCIRGTGLATDYDEYQNTIQLGGTDNNYNLISNNNCMGKAVTNEGGAGNTLVNNKFDAT